MITLSAPTAYLGGTIAIPDQKKSIVNEITARVTTTATLDGGSVVVNSGVSDTDRMIRIKSTINRDIETMLWYMLKNFSSLIFCVESVCYLAAIKSLKTDNGILNMRLFIISTETT